MQVFLHLESYGVVLVISGIVKELFLNKCQQKLHSTGCSNMPRSVAMHLAMTRHDYVNIKNTRSEILK